jgi:hypothetical protein
VTGHEGPRVYEKNALDTRIGDENKEVPFARSWQEAVSLMGGENIGNEVQIAVGTAKRIGLFK